MPKLDLSEIEQLATESPSKYGGTKTLSADVASLLLSLLDFAHRRYYWLNGYQASEWDSIEELIGKATEEII